MSFLLIYFVLFEQKKVNLETLSEYLKSVRENFKFSQSSVSAKTGIKIKFLEKLEQGLFGDLPPEVYVLGFLRQLASLYRIEPEILISQYKKESLIQKQLGRPVASTGSKFTGQLKKIIITPKKLSIGLGLIFVIFTLIYIIWQVFSINRSPSLDILEPKNNQIIKDSFVNISGKTDPGMTVTINNEPIFVDKDGNFKKQMGLSAGPKTLTVVAKNKFDKSVSRQIDVMGQSAATSLDQHLGLKLDFSGDAEIKVSIDDAAALTMAFHKGDSKVFIGKNKILISTSDAGATKATLNNQVLGSLGRPKEKLENIPFFAGSNTQEPNK